MKDTVSFFKSFLSNSKTTGAVAPSSRYLTRKLLGHIVVNKCNTVIELGPGTGVFTRYLLKHLPANATLVCIEFNTVFCKRLREINDPRLIVVEDSAWNIVEIARKYNVASPDVVISSLPLSNFTVDERSKLLHTISQMIGTQGDYLQYQYSRRNFREFLPHFKVFTRKYEPRNIPPAWCYHGYNKS